MNYRRHALVIVLLALAAFASRWRVLNGADGQGVAVRETDGVWLTWSNPPPRFDLEYTLTLPATNWTAFIRKVDTNPLPSISIQVMQPTDQRFWRIVPR